jgi:hypothetical protein
MLEKCPNAHGITLQGRGPSNLHVGGRQEQGGDHGAPHGGFPTDQQRRLDKQPWAAGRTHLAASWNKDGSSARREVEEKHADLRSRGTVYTSGSSSEGRKAAVRGRSRARRSAAPRVYVLTSNHGTDRTSLCPTPRGSPNRKAHTQKQVHVRTTYSNVKVLNTQTPHFAKGWGGLVLQCSSAAVGVGVPDSPRWTQGAPHLALEPRALKRACNTHA